MASVYTIVAFWSWLVLFLVWLPGYFTSKRSIDKPNRSRQLVINLCLIAGFFLVFSYRALAKTPFFGMQIIPHTVSWGIAGMVLDTFSIMFAIWARITIGRNWSGTVTLQKGHELVQSGPYAFVRHPIYGGMLLAMLGTALTIGLLASFLGILLAATGFLARVQQEDELMAREFTELHSAYKQKTKKLIPFVW